MMPKCSNPVCEQIPTFIHHFMLVVPSFPVLLLKYHFFFILTCISLVTSVLAFSHVSLLELILSFEWPILLSYIYTFCHWNEGQVGLLWLPWKSWESWSLCNDEYLSSRLMTETTHCGKYFCDIFSKNYMSNVFCWDLDGELHSLVPFFVNLNWFRSLMGLKGETATVYFLCEFLSDEVQPLYGSYKHGHDSAQNEFPDWCVLTYMWTRQKQWLFSNIVLV